MQASRTATPASVAACCPPSSWRSSFAAIVTRRLQPAITVTPGAPSCFAIALASSPAASSRSTDRPVPLVSCQRHTARAPSDRIFRDPSSETPGARAIQHQRTDLGVMPTQGQEESYQQNGNEDVFEGLNYRRNRHREEGPRSVSENGTRESTRQSPDSKPI